MVFFGIDPGLHGAIAGLDAQGVPFLLDDMPLELGWYNIHAIYEILSQYSGRGGTTIGLEAVYRFPKITRGFGLLEGVSTLVPHSKVIKIPPRRWQKWWGIKKADKNLSRDLALGHFLDYAHKLYRKMDHNRAEALLIAEYTRKNYNDY